jgi:hypothetical protein
MTLSLLAIGLTVVAYGASTVSTREGAGTPIRETRHAVKEDLLGMMAVKGVASQVAQTALHLKAGRLALAESGLQITSKAVFSVSGH